MPDTHDPLEARRWFRRRLAELGTQYPHLKYPEAQERLTEDLRRQTEEDDRGHGSPPATPEIDPKDAAE